MQVKCIKDTIGFKKGDILEANSKGFIGSKNFSDNFEWYYKAHTEYFQEQKEEETKKPKWKVGDYVVFTYESGNIKFLKIFEIQKSSVITYNRYYGEANLRDPTQEELSIYFR